MGESCLHKDGQPEDHKTELTGGGICQETLQVRLDQRQDAPPEDSDTGNDACGLEEIGTLWDHQGAGASDEIGEPQQAGQDLPGAGTMGAVTDDQAAG